MARATKTTTDHEEIRRWAEAQGGRPSAAKGTGEGDDPGVLRLDFPGFSGEDTLRPLSWDEFFQAFDDNQLALLYRPDDRFNKLISRVMETSPAKPRRARKAASPQPAAARRSRAAMRSPRAKKTTSTKSGRSKAAPRSKGRGKNSGRKPAGGRRRG
jgi:hypothetical protein